MAESKIAFSIDLFATTLEDFADHFELDFCRQVTFNSEMPGVRWVNKSNANFEEFDWTYRDRKGQNEKRYRGSGINFQRYDYQWERNKPYPFIHWEVRGYGTAQKKVRQIFHTVEATRYRTDKLRVVIEEGQRYAGSERYEDGLFIKVFVDWLDARWGKLDEGYKRLSQENTSKNNPKPLTMRQQEVAALTADGLEQREIAKELVITVETVKTLKMQIRKRLGINGGNLSVSLRQMGYGTSSR